MANELQPRSDPPPREEWDFRARSKTDWYDDRKYGPFAFLAEDEVYYCTTYEFYRMDGDVPFVLKNRQKLPAWLTWQQAIGKSSPLPGQDKETLRSKTFDALLDNHLRSSLDKQVFLEWFSIPWPEWPAEPYLSIPRPERMRRFEASWKDNPPRALPLVELKKICNAARDYSEGKTPTGLRFWSAGYELILNADTWVYSRRFGRQANQSPTELAAFEIDFNKPNKRLLRLFDNWLRNRRKEKGYKPHETRGPSSDTDRMRNRLLALGAGRLIQTGMNIITAMRYTEKLTGQPFFKDKRAWERAIRFASEWL